MSSVNTGSPGASARIAAPRMTETEPRCVATAPTGSPAARARRPANPSTATSPSARRRISNDAPIPGPCTARSATLAWAQASDKQLERGSPGTARAVLLPIRPWHHPEVQTGRTVPPPADHGPWSMRSSRGVCDAGRRSSRHVQVRATPAASGLSRRAARALLVRPASRKKKRRAPSWLKASADTRGPPARLGRRTAAASRADRQPWPSTDGDGLTEEPASSGARLPNQGCEGPQS
jgi:hypothetical protein